MIEYAQPESMVAHTHARGEKLLKCEPYAVSARGDAYIHNLNAICTMLPAHDVNLLVRFHKEHERSTVGAFIFRITVGSAMEERLGEMPKVHMCLFTG